MKSFLGKFYQHLAISTATGSKQAKGTVFAREVWGGAVRCQHILVSCFTCGLHSDLVVECFTRSSTNCVRQIVSMRESGAQCDQVAILDFNYLAIYNNENMPQALPQVVPKWVRNFAHYQMNLENIAKTSTFLSKWRNFSKSVNTGGGLVHLLPLSAISVTIWWNKKLPSSPPPKKKNVKK